jgi:hypothetical protein
MMGTVVAGERAPGGRRLAASQAQISKYAM